MCGIAGFIGAAPNADPIALLNAMSGAIAHRGPDGEGTFVSPLGRDGELVGLGHRRLAIIDLEGGVQPMATRDNALQVVFNGEIYNFAELAGTLAARGHDFDTRSDTEVILHAYEEFGDMCVDHLRGMFAFALWDGPRQRLLLARDRFGQKPLFFSEVGGTLAFASEIKALQMMPGLAPELDRSALADYFLHRYVPAPRTLFKGVRKLEAGSVAVWHDGRLTERRYYSPPDSRTRASASAGVDAPDPVSGFLSHLDDAVRSCMVSDVPFGAFLSGGIDSSVIVALMSKHSDGPINTYSVGFAEEPYSELSAAKLVADRFATRHNELIVSYDDVIDGLAAATRFLDSPISEPSDIPIHLLARTARLDVKMVLTGEGSDEILAGYPKHVAERYLSPALRFLPDEPRRRIGELLARRMPYQRSRVATAASALALGGDSDRYARWFGALSPADCERLLARPSAVSGRQAIFAAAYLRRKNSPLRNVLSSDQRSWLADNLLERDDRMTMAASLEARAPFLDEALVAYVSSLPDHYRVSGLRTKSILRDAVRTLLPPEIINRPKVGFRVPVGEWFRGPLHDYLYEHLVGSRAQIGDYVKRGALLNVLTEHSSGARNHEKLLWTLLALELWLSECLAPRQRTVALELSQRDGTQLPAGKLATPQGAAA